MVKKWWKNIIQWHTWFAFIGHFEVLPGSRTGVLLERFHVDRYPTGSFILAHGEDSLKKRALFHQIFLWSSSFYHRLIDWLIDWAINWGIDWLIERLIDWLVKLEFLKIKIHSIMSYIWQFSTRRLNDVIPPPPPCSNEAKIRIDNFFPPVKCSQQLLWSYFFPLPCIPSSQWTRAARGNWLNERHAGTFSAGNIFNDVRVPHQWMMGDPSVGDPSVGDPSVGDPSVGDPSVGDPSVGDPSVGDPSVGDPSRLSLLKKTPERGAISSMGGSRYLRCMASEWGTVRFWRWKKCLQEIDWLEHWQLALSPERANFCVGLSFLAGCSDVDAQTPSYITTHTLFIPLPYRRRFFLVSCTGNPFSWTATTVTTVVHVADSQKTATPERTFDSGSKEKMRQIFS